MKCLGLPFCIGHYKPLELTTTVSTTTSNERETPGDGNIRANVSHYINIFSLAKK